MTINKTIHEHWRDWAAVVYLFLCVVDFFIAPLMWNIGMTMMSDVAVNIMQIIDTSMTTSRGVVQGQTLTYPLEHTVHVTGHSLGGAVAQIIGMWLHKRGKNVQVFSYGSPKVSNQVLSGGQPTHWRVVRRSDPIPFTPPWPYSHTGVFIDSEDLDWGPDNDNGLISKTDGLDHAIAKYVTTLKEQL
jgi:hypothetical protein